MDDEFEKARMKIEIELDFNDLMLLGANGTLQKGDSTVTINRPVLPEEHRTTNPKVAGEALPSVPFEEKYEHVQVGDEWNLVATLP